jgi:STE24 endopeptidase
LYGDFWARRLFGLSAEPQLTWLTRQALEAATEAVPFIVGVVVLYWLLRHFPRSWWLLASLGYALSSLGMAYAFPLVITPLFFDQRPLTDQALRAQIIHMGARIGVPVQDVFVIDASKQGNEGNAYVAGVGQTTRIVLFDTLLNDYPADELLSIVAHEMGHWRARHIWKGLILSWIVAPPALFAVDRLLRRLLPRWGIRSPDDIASLPYLLLLLNLALLATLPLQNWQSRRWETEADRLGVAATGDRAAFARTFVRLAHQNLANPTPPPLVEALFATHPAIGRRVAQILDEPHP